MSNQYDEETGIYDDEEYDEENGEMMSNKYDEENGQYDDEEYDEENGEMMSNQYDEENGEMMSNQYHGASNLGSGNRFGYSESMKRPLQGKQATANKETFKRYRGFDEMNYVPDTTECRSLETLLGRLDAKYRGFLRHPESHPSFPVIREVFESSYRRVVSDDLGDRFRENQFQILWENKMAEMKDNEFQESKMLLKDAKKFRKYVPGEPRGTCWSSLIDQEMKSATFQDSFNFNQKSNFQSDSAIQRKEFRSPEPLKENNATFQKLTCYALGSFLKDLKGNKKMQKRYAPDPKPKQQSTKIKKNKNTQVNPGKNNSKIKQTRGENKKRKIERLMRMKDFKKKKHLKKYENSSVD